MPGFPLFDQLKIGRKSVHDFITACSKRRAFVGEGKNKMNREKLSARGEPVEKGLGIFVPSFRIDRAVQGVLENEVVGFPWFVFEEVSVGKGKIGECLILWRASPRARSERSMPVVSNPASAHAAASCPLPQPGTSTRVSGSFAVCLTLNLLIREQVCSCPTVCLPPGIFHSNPCPSITLNKSYISGEQWLELPVVNLGNRQ